MVTIKDIAAKSGVSVSTVSRVINNHPYVKDDVRAKVLKVIEEEHFVPHEGAASLAKTPENSIGLIFRGMGNIFFGEMLPLLERRIRAEGYTCVIHQITTKEDELQAAATLAKSRRLSGIILLGGKFNYTDEDIASVGVPCICCTYANAFGTMEKHRISSVCINDKEEAKKAVKHLYENGHRKIAIVLPTISDQSIAELRFQGFIDAYRELDLKLDTNLIVETGNYSMESAYAEVKKWLATEPDFTALFAISDTIAMASIKAMSENGLSVPDDRSVIAIDGIELSRFALPTLTTLVQPKEEMADETIELLHNMIQGKSRGHHVDVPTILRLGDSVRSI